MLNIIENGWGLDLIVWFQSWRTSLISLLFAPFNYLAREEVLLVLLPLVYWTVNKSFGRRLVFVTLLSTWTNLWLKNLWMRPRPFMVANSPVTPVFEYHSYGLPSGHTMLAATTAGYCAFEIRKRWFTTVSILFAFLMGLSRLVHGVHYLQDVVTGILLSFIIVIIFSRFERLTADWLKRQPIFLQLFLALFSGALFFIIYRFSPADQEEIQNCLSLAALGSGALAGSILEMKYTPFRTDGRFRQKLARIGVGFLGLAFLYIGLRFPAYALIAKFPDSSFLEGVLRVIRYLLLGFWVAWGAPLVFIKIGLASECDGDDPGAV